MCARNVASIPNREIVKGVTGQAKSMTTMMINTLFLNPETARPHSYGSTAGRNSDDGIKSQSTRFGFRNILRNNRPEKCHFVQDSESGKSLKQNSY